ncbi:phosphoenolpyruvate carboxykinase (ATP), partial [Acinetobacter baumannii]
NDEGTKDQIWWDNNKPMSRAHFDVLLADFQAAVKDKEIFVQDLYGGADKTHRLPTRVFAEYAWHALFIRHLLRRPGKSELAGFEPGF